MQDQLFSFAIESRNFKLEYENIEPKCPKIKRTALTDGQFDVFLKNESLRKSLEYLSQLPIDLLINLRISAFAYQKEFKAFKMVKELNFFNMHDDLAIINYLNSMIKRRGIECIDFLEGVPIFIQFWDEIHTKHIDQFFEEHQYIYPGCSDIACSKEKVHQIVFNAPIFVYSKHVVDRDHPTYGNYYLEQNKPLLPDPYNLVEAFWDTEKDINACSAENPWETKQLKLFFRGQNGQSSMDISDDCVVDAYNGKNPRLGAILEGLKHPDFVDARYSECLNESQVNFLSCLEQINNKIGISSQVAHHLISMDYRSRHDHLKYKYLLSVDGWTAAWGRISWILNSNSVLVKQKSTIVQWYYSEMIDGVHYIEIPENFEIDKLKKWALENDEKAKKIADNGHNLYLDLFSRESIDDIVFTTFYDYFNAYQAGDASVQLGMLNMIS